MNFITIKASIEIIKEGAFGGTYFRDICSGINEKWYKNSWIEFFPLKMLMLNIMHQIVMMWMWINMV